jgi:hypothetical protein
LSVGTSRAVPNVDAEHRRPSEDDQFRLPGR